MKYTFNGVCHNAAVLCFFFNMYVWNKNSCIAAICSAAKQTCKETPANLRHLETNSQGTKFASESIELYVTVSLREKKLAVSICETHSHDIASRTNVGSRSQ